MVQQQVEARHPPGGSSRQSKQSAARPSSTSSNCSSLITMHDGGGVVFSMATPLAISSAKTEYERDITEVTGVAQLLSRLLEARTTSFNEEELSLFSEQ